MILIDGVKSKVDKAWEKTFTKPIVYRLHQSRATYDHNTKMTTFPQTTGLEAFFSFVDKGEIKEFRYSTVLPGPGKGNNTRFSPEYLYFPKRGEIICDPSVPADVEKAYFFYMHPQNVGGPNEDKSKRPLFYKVDNAATAREIMKREDDRFEAESYVKKEWKGESLILKEAALALGIPYSEDMSDEEIQIGLLKEVAKDPSLFLARIAEYDVTYRSYVAEGLTHGIITFNNENRKWYWGPNTTKEGVEIVSVKSTEDSKARLIAFFNNANVNKEENREYFVNRLNEEKTKATKAKKPLKTAVTE